VPASVLYMSMSLDGYIAGPNDGPGHPGGDRFMRLHEWFVRPDGVLDEVQISQIPVLFGGGRRLFEVLPSRVELEIVRVIDTPEATHIRYRVSR
jgi:dihydrofolate reductase